MFEGFDERERNAIRQAFAANWHEGCEPNRADVADLTEHARGRLTDEEYMQRGRERIAAARARAASWSPVTEFTDWESYFYSGT